MKNRKKKVMWAVAIIAASTAWLTLGSPAVAEKGIKDTEISLRKFDVIGIPNVPLFDSIAMTPGYNELIPKAFDGAPPQIPHLLEKMLVNLAKNDCMECHTAKENDAGDPPISISHFTDETGKTLVARRHFCETCHVVQADAEPLVRNTFTD